MDGMRYLHISPHNSGYGCDTSLDVSWLDVSHDTGCDITIYRDISCDITPDNPKAPGKNSLNKNRPPCCGLRFALAPCLCPILAFSPAWPFFVVLLLPIRWTHHRTDCITSKHQPCPFMTRPTTWVHGCFWRVFLFSFLVSYSFLLYIYRMVSVSRYPKHVLGIDIETYRKHEISHDIPRNLDTIQSSSF